MSLRNNYVHIKYYKLYLFFLCWMGMWDFFFKTARNPFNGFLF